MQGIWEDTGNSLGPEKGFFIVRDIYSLGLTFWNETLDFPLSESVVGFQDNNSGDGDSLFANSLKKDGPYYTVIDKGRTNKFGWVHQPFYFIPQYFEIREDFMAINGGKLHELTRLNRLPEIALRMLYNRGKRDRRDYIKDYLGIKVVEIKKQKETVYSLPDKPTNIQLSEGDVVTIVEENRGWLKIDYGAGNLGWIKKPFGK